jgi:hypothetical protein
VLSRRGLIVGAAGMVGRGGMPPRRIDQGTREPIGVVIGPGARNVIRARQVIISGPGSGLFVYSGTPATGNLNTSITAVAGTDPFGNAYLAGDTIYWQAGGKFYALGLATNFPGLVGYVSSSAAGPYFRAVPPPISAASISITSNADLALTATSLLLGRAGQLTIVGPSNDATGVADSTAISAALARGSVLLLSGTYYTNATISLTSGQYLYGAGRGATIINWISTGSCFSAHDSSTYSTRTIHGGGIIGLTIDGTASGVSSRGIHMGDIRSWHIDVGVRNFTNTNGIGVLFENDFFFTEWLHGRIEAENNAQNVVFNVAGGTVSFDRADLDIYVIQNQVPFDGLVMENGAQIVHGILTLRGNFSATAAGVAGRVIALTGGNAGIFESQVEVGVECSGAGAVIPQTISFGAGTQIARCSGIMRFLGDGPPAAFAPSNPAGGLFEFTGPVLGDPSLGTTEYYGSFGQPNITANGQTFFTNQGSVIRITSAAAFTGLIVQPGQFDGQVCYILNSGAFTLTMAAAGVSNVANGVACVVQPTAALCLVWNAVAALWFEVRQ